MTMHGKFTPLDVRSLWGMNEESLGNAETVFRTWCELSGRVHEHAVKFMSNRATKDAAVVAQLGRCRTPVDAMNIQMTYLTGAYADYVNEGQKIVGFFGDVVRETLPGMSAEQAPSTSGKSKHSPHRVAAH
jgi:hypothetical protein